MLDIKGLKKVRQWSFLAQVLNAIDKDVPILPEITRACINTHLLSASKLTEMQIFELMYFVIANQSVVDLIN